MSERLHSPVRLANQRCVHPFLGLSRRLLHTSVLRRPIFANLVHKFTDTIVKERSLYGREVDVAIAKKTNPGLFTRMLFRHFFTGGVTTVVVLKIKLLLLLSAHVHVLLPATELMRSYSCLTSHGNGSCLLGCSTYREPSESQENVERALRSAGGVNRTAVQQ